MNPQKFLMILGIVLLLAVGLIGTWTFVKRHQNQELIPATPTSPSAESSTVQAPNSEATVSPAPTPEAVPPAAKPGFNKKKYSTGEPASAWVVVNKKRALNPTSYAPTDLVSVGNNQQLRKEAADALATMIAAAKTEGLSISALSGYRSYSRQETVYANEVKNYGQAVADTESAKPGHSEHQTGWAVDVGGGGCGIEDCFGTTAEGKWVAAHAYEYGFIVRYTAAKQEITGYRAEPWHIRYIGTELSAEMHKQNVITLEEFFGL